MRFVDVSNLQPTLTPSALDALYAAGIRGVVVGCQYPGRRGNAAENIDALDADGRFVVAAYAENTPVATVLQHVSAQRLSRMPFIAVACEEGGGFEDEPSVRAQLRVIESLDGPEAWVYSSPYEWQVLGMTGDFSAYKGWCADYDDDPSSPAPSFGGVTVAGKQYSAHGQIPGLGFEVDLSEIEVGVEPTKVVNADAIEAIKAAVHGIGQQDGEWIAQDDGPVTLTVIVPSGYRAITALVKE